MKLISSILIVILFIAGCSKEHDSMRALIGLWVEKEHRADTIEVYKSGSKTIMFDKTEYRRAVMQGFSGPDQHFRHQVLLKKEGIGFRPAEGGVMQEFFYYSFEWIEPKKEFRMSNNGLRPYLSSISSANWVRVN